MKKSEWIAKTATDILIASLQSGAVRDGAHRNHDLAISCVKQAESLAAILLERRHPAWDLDDEVVLDETAELNPSIQPSRTRAMRELACA